MSSHFGLQRVTIREAQAASCCRRYSRGLTPDIWRNRRETSEEILLLIKSGRHCYPALEQAILSLHPYELPEIIAVPVEQGLPGYLRWVDQCTTKNL